MPVVALRSHAQVVIVMAAVLAGCGRADERLTQIQAARSGDIDVVVLSPAAELHRKDTFVVEFRSATTGALVEVGSVKAAATMPMAGSPMFGTIDVKPTKAAGRFEANSDFSMAGTWRIRISWSGPVGAGSVESTLAVR